MTKMLAALALLASCASALATPVQFGNVSYTTTAFASAGATFDGPRTDDFPTSALPLLTSATASSATDTANATAIADQQFLATTADASSATDPAGAGAFATFTGSFVPSGDRPHFTLNFDSQSSGPGSAANQLEFILVADGVTVFDEIFFNSVAIDRDFTLPAGILATLDLTLSSTADALLNDAFSLSSVDFSLSVPEPSTAFLLLAGAMALAFFRARESTLVRLAAASHSEPAVLASDSMRST